MRVDYSTYFFYSVLLPFYMPVTIGKKINSKNNDSSKERTIRPLVHRWASWGARGGNCPIEMFRRPAHVGTRSYTTVYGVRNVRPGLAKVVLAKFGNPDRNGTGQTNYWWKFTCTKKWNYERCLVWISIM